MAEIKKNNGVEKVEEVPILQYLSDNRKKLEVLLSAEPKAAIYQIAGQRKTRTVYIAELLQNVMVEYCSKNKLTMAEFCETAIIRFLVASGFEDKINQILLNNLDHGEPKSSQSQDKPPESLIRAEPT